MEIRERSGIINLSNPSPGEGDVAESVRLDAFP